MFRSYEKTDGQSFINTFSPEVRDTAYFHAFNQILRLIENAVGLSYGTLSEVSDVEKTAEEVRSSKQRSFSRVKDIQENLRNALEQMLYGMQFYQYYYRSQSSRSTTPEIAPDAIACPVPYAPAADTPSPDLPAHRPQRQRVP